MGSVSTSKKSNPFTLIDKRSLTKLCLWIILTIVILFFVIWFTIEKSTVNSIKIKGKPDSVFFGGWSIIDIKNGIAKGWITTSGTDRSMVNGLPMPTNTAGDDKWTLTQAYVALYGHAKYSLIDFSLMTFVSNAFKAPPTDPATAWTVRSNAVDLAYSYMFISFLIAAIALIMQIWYNAKMIKENNKIRKYGLSTKYPSSTLNYSLFSATMWVDFIVNLAIIFCFFNFLATLIIIGYWIIIGIINSVLSKTGYKVDSNAKEHKSEMIYLFAVMIFQTVYTIIKSIFLSKWGVNLDLVFQIVLPIGTITVIVGLFIKKMLSSKVTAVTNAIKGIGGVISTFRTFFYTNKADALDDFNFVNILPPMIKGPLTAHKVDKPQAETLMEQLDEAVKFVETHYAKAKGLEKNYLLYTLFNTVTCVDEITEIKNNILQKESYFAKHNIKPR